MKTIDLSLAMNPARYGALHHAQEQANRDGKAMRVYVAPPDAPQVLSKCAFNVWYVRPFDAPAPEGAELVQEVAPKQ